MRMWLFVPRADSLCASKGINPAYCQVLLNSCGFYFTEPMLSPMKKMNHLPRSHTGSHYWVGGFKLSILGAYASKCFAKTTLWPFIWSSFVLKCEEELHGAMAWFSLGTTGMMPWHLSFCKGLQCLMSESFLNSWNMKRLLKNHNKQLKIVPL